MPLLKIWINRKFGINYAAGSLYDLVHRIGYSLQRPKKQCRNADPEKKQLIVQTNSKGSRKRKVIFGACNPKTGEVIYSIEEAGNSESFEDFLK